MTSLIVNKVLICIKRFTNFRKESPIFEIQSGDTGKRSENGKRLQIDAWLLVIITSQCLKTINSDKPYRDIREILIKCKLKERKK